MRIAAKIPISDFAKLSRTTRATLLHYDRIGLLSPVQRGDNKYRYYTAGQIPVVNLIRTMQSFGLSLDEIKRLKDSRTPERMSASLAEQIQQIDSKISEWTGAKKLLHTVKKTIDAALSAENETVAVQKMPAEAIVQGPLNDYSGGRDDYDALLDFYDHIKEEYPDMNVNYPVWAMISEERIKRGDFTWPDRYYFSNPDGHDRKPAALYAVGYTRGGYGDSGKLYGRMLRYIDENGYEICGNTYEEYPLNELCVSDGADYLIRVLIPVREKKRP